MHTVLTIAWKDLRTGLFSMRAAAVFFFLLGFMGIFFYTFIDSLLGLQSMYPERPAGLEVLVSGIFNNLHFILLLVIPAVTMSVYSEEKRNHTWRLLSSAPVKPLHIVLGRYLAVLALMGLVFLASWVFPLYLLVLGNPDVGIILSSYLGLLMLTSSYIAFGLCVSSLTSHQFLAFLFTVAGIFLMLILNWVAVHLPAGKGVSGFFRYLASVTHLENFFAGLITVQDLMYFLTLTAVFLFLNLLIVDLQRWR